MTNDQQPDPEKLLSEADRLLEVAEELIEEAVHLEECAKEGRHPPRAKKYYFKVNDTLCFSEHETIKGRHILEKAGLVPPEDYTLREKMSGAPPQRIGLDEEVNLRKPGIEKFRAIKKGQQEGEIQHRRAAPVLEQDRLFLDRYGLPWEAISEGNTWILLHEYRLPTGAVPATVTVAIRLETGYPITALDMMYVYPPVSRQDGRAIPCTEARQALDGKQFQRWSRHRTGVNPWIPGEDSLETHVYLIEEYFRAEFAR